MANIRTAKYVKITELLLGMVPRGGPVFSLVFMHLARGGEVQTSHSSPWLSDRSSPPLSECLEPSRCGGRENVDVVNEGRLG